MREVASSANPPDWFPDDTALRPVVKGKPVRRAGMRLLHLMSDRASESADIAALPVEYSCAR